MNKKVSVLIPVYNAEKYLRECLDSVLAQSWTNFEVICCNDGSTDRSPEILREYAARDKRITVLSKKNEGSSATRNVCLEKATGDYLYFVDNDDMIAPDTLKDLVEAAEKDDLEMLKQVSEQSQRLTRDSEEMENLNRTLTGISRVYEMQLKSASAQISTIDEINAQTRHMAEQIVELNKIYARMIEAMQVRSQM